MFSPALVALPINPKYFLYILPLVLFFDRNFLRILVSFKKYIISLFIIWLFCLFREINVQEFIFFKIIFYLLFECVLIPVSIIYLFEFRLPISGKKYNFIFCCIFIGFVAALISIFLLANPQYANIVRYNILVSDFFTDLVEFRTFGLADGLTFSYGVTLGILAGISLILSHKNKLLLILIPFFLFAIMINARTGFTPFLISVLFYLLYFSNIKSLFWILSIVFLGILISPLFAEFFNTNSFLIEWGLDFFIQINNFITGNKSDGGTTFSTLFGDMFILPETSLEWLFGRGINLFDYYGGNSDVGYIIQLNYGGIIYIFLILAFLLLSIFESKKFDKEQRVITYILILTFLVCNVKGNMFTSIGAFRVIMLFIIYFIMKITFKSIITEKIR